MRNAPFVNRANAIPFIHSAPNGIGEPAIRETESRRHSRFRQKGKLFSEANLPVSRPVGRVGNPFEHMVKDQERHSDALVVHKIRRSPGISSRNLCGRRPEPIPEPSVVGADVAGYAEVVNPTHKISIL